MQLIAATATIAIALLVYPAFADERSPCARGTLSPMSGAVDLDVIRCQVALDTQRLGELQSQLNATTAALLLAKDDASREKEAAAKMQATLDWWKSAAMSLWPSDK